MVDGEPVCHIAASPKFESGYFRLTRLVTMPEWQGAGVGTKFLNWVAEYHKRGNGRKGRQYPALFHTSHPQLISYLNRSRQWVLKSQVLFGGNKANSRKTIRKADKKRSKKNLATGAGYGGHFRAVQGFKYLGDGLSPKTGLPD